MIGNDIDDMLMYQDMYERSRPSRLYADTTPEDLEELWADYSIEDLAGALQSFEEDNMFEHAQVIMRLILSKDAEYREDRE